jgi:hypothetical protein
MANHLRQQIRAALEAALTGLATASTVYVGRTAPIDADNLPALVLMTSEESAEREAKGDHQARTLTATIEGHAQQASGILDAFDQIAKEVEVAIATDAPLAALVKSMDLTGTEVEITGEAIQPAGLVRLTYQLVYHTQSAAPDVAL